MKLQDFLTKYYPEIDLSIIAENTESITDGGNVSDNIDINAVIRDGKYAGKSIAYCLASHDCGPEILLRDQALRMRITEQVLNAVDIEKQSVVFCLTQSREGCMVLAADNGKLINMISKDALNAVVATGPRAGTSALFWLAGTHHGRELLHLHPSLREMITPQDLNHVIASGKQAGESILLWLALDNHGRRVLTADDGRLIGEIRKDALNAVVASGPFAGKSALFWLAFNPDGRDLLYHEPSLIDMITPQGMNHVITSGQLAGTSALFWLALDNQNRSVLTADGGRLIREISKDALNAVAVYGPYVGTSALFWLASTEDGRSMLAANRDLCGKITLTGIKSVDNQTYEIKSTLMYLLEDRQTRVIFAKVEQLKRLINEIISQSSEGLNKDMLSILTFAPTLISGIDDRMRFKGLIRHYIQEIAQEEKTQILRQYAGSIEGKRFLTDFTQYHPKKAMNHYSLPACVDKALSDLVENDQEESTLAILEDGNQETQILQTDPISYRIIINPVRLWSAQSDSMTRGIGTIHTGNTTGPFEYEGVYWTLLMNGVNPMSQVQIRSDNQDPDEVIIAADDPLMQSNNLLVPPAQIKEAIATWLSDRLSNAEPKKISIVSRLIQYISVQADDDPLKSPKVSMLVDILQDENGLSFLMAFKEVVQAKLTLSDFMVPLHQLPEAGLKNMLERYCDAEQSMMLKEDSQATLCDLLASTEAGQALLNLLAPENTAMADQGLFANAAGAGLVSPRNR